MFIKYGILVIYNKKISESRSYRSLLSQDLTLLVVDNSTERQFVDFNQSTVKQNHQIYIAMEGNKGLPKAYNKAIDWIFSHKEDPNNYVVLLDDDTNIPSDFVKKMNEEIKKSLKQIYLPVVKDSLGILSPSKMSKHGYCHRIQKIEELTPQNICGINSGMVIQLFIFGEYRYDQRMFLDYVDHSFMRDMRNKNIKIQVVDTVLEQSFSAVTDSNSSARNRLRILKKDLNCFYDQGFISRIIYHYVMIRRIFRHIVYYKDISILWALK